ncbi:hypothetical protein H6G97_21700 [Nostoc flagelliforme FACHB-838]|uniref:Uncharacterized protein n=1 Tax=Nostoc flagelliforme FACHB-838 TaxID=2692904 RepID=A0ABR8DS57_9NOSO|nr:hypothetical protein [Nostoc flagelliforme]MBD2532058.1 hypothetical protein [Nostoc flagelliforme FACHB-838]
MQKNYFITQITAKRIRSNNLASCCFPPIQMIKSRFNSKNFSGVCWAIAEE